MQTEAAESAAELEEEKDAMEPQSDGDSIPLEGADESSAGVPGKTVATPGGDNEFAPDQPLESVDDGHRKQSAVGTGPA